ncbi:permease [Rufibacter radiotolerans]|uniref:Permease n=1 Tax=Rufibacter radiotolerans TaxID=1379910 RepID=A0A0H4VUK5_9BACT|nr:AI-2E family transporter [Rufibacter radiotolerans]AKQ47587.1 permease [Rufibacter radiotolerans]
METLPITVRRSIEFMGLFFLGWLLVSGGGIIAPIFIAFFFSIMLLPVYRFLVRKRLPEVVAITLCIMLLLIIFGLILWFFSSQVRNLVNDLPVIQQNIKNHLAALSAWINRKTHFSPNEQLNFIDEQSNRLLSYAGKMLGGAAGSFTSAVVFIGLMPIYVFLILFYKNILLRFIFLWFPKKRHTRVRDALSETEVIIKSYLMGLLIQISYMTVLVGGTLFLLGIKHALLIGIIFAFLNLIPYVGALIGNILGVLLTLASSQEILPIFLVLGTIAVAQILDNHILMPRIVGSKVKINALATIVGVLVAGKMAGIAGMFLSLPLIAVLKIIFDRTDSLKQWGVLLGDERPTATPMTAPELRQQTETVKTKLEEENEIKPPDA